LQKQQMTDLFVVPFLQLMTLDTHECQPEIAVKF